MRSIPMWGRLGLAALLCVAFIALIAAKPSEAPAFPVVKIIVNGGHGSGANLGGGYILTAGHVSEDAGAVTVMTPDGIQHEGEVLWSNHGPGSYDVSLVYVHSLRDTDGADLSCEVPKLGQEIVILGNPKMSNWIKTWGRVANPDIGPSAFNLWRQIIVLDATATNGNSGGPVLDAKTGEIVGILVGGYPGTGITFMVPGKTLCHMLGRA